MAKGRKRLYNVPVPLQPSILESPECNLLSSPSYQQTSPAYSPLAFNSVTNALLENPNLNSTHLYRADIILDTSNELKTNDEKEILSQLSPYSSRDNGFNTELEYDGNAKPRPSCHFKGYRLQRTVVRKLIPRNPQMDDPLVQTCHIYSTIENALPVAAKSVPSRAEENGLEDLPLNKSSVPPLSKFNVSMQASSHLVVYQPHVSPANKSLIPWYHPPLSHLAFLYTSMDQNNPSNGIDSGAEFSIHFQLIQDQEKPTMRSVSDRLHRTLLSLLSTYVRLTCNTPVHINQVSGEQEAIPKSAMQAIKDNIVPEHRLQNTYTRLKMTYASDLINRWVEKTDPSKHVFEDLSIAAFLIELWKQMYGNNPADFPGFVDIACGNGVLVYCLLQEGYRGYGLDARARRTWTIFPENVTSYLYESVCVPEPFLKALKAHQYPIESTLSIHDGIFAANTFIISNHADELTAWTPILAALSGAESPLPWLAIPCCSHSLSGRPHRYPSSRSADHQSKADRPKSACCTDLAQSPDDQSPTGDLRAIRAAKLRDADHIKNGQVSNTSSTYASLVGQVTALAIEFEAPSDVRQTLLRIPSTRNIGIVSGAGRLAHAYGQRTSSEERCTRSNLASPERPDASALRGVVDTIVERECSRSGGVLRAAETWMQRIQRLKAKSTVTPTN